MLDGVPVFVDEPVRFIVLIDEHFGTEVTLTRRPDDTRWLDEVDSDKGRARERNRQVGAGDCRGCLRAPRA
jgi:hypothetical protein